MEKLVEREESNTRGASRCFLRKFSKFANFHTPPEIPAREDGIEAVLEAKSRLGAKVIRLDEPAINQPNTYMTETAFVSGLMKDIQGCDSGRLSAARLSSRVAPTGIRHQDPFATLRLPWIRSPLIAKVFNTRGEFPSQQKC